MEMNNQQHIAAPRDRVWAAAGHARGSANVALNEDAAGTMLTYVVDAQVGGKIAQLGARLIQSTSQKLAGEFFNKFEKQVAATPVE